METFEKWQDDIWDNCECCKNIYGNGKAAWNHQQRKIDKLTKCIKDNLAHDENVFGISDGKGANSFCILTARQCLKEMGE